MLKLKKQIYSKNIDELSAGTVVSNFILKTLIKKNPLMEEWFAEDVELGKLYILTFLSKKLSHEEWVKNLIINFQRDSFTVHHYLSVKKISVFNHRYCFISDYAEGKTLDKILKSEFKVKENEAIRILSNVAKILNEIFKKSSSFHLNLTPSNIIVGSKCEVFIKGGGIISEIFRNILSFDKYINESLYYTSPENIKSEQLSEKSDIYSLGLIFHNMLAGTNLFVGTSDFDLISKQLVKVPELSTLREVCSRNLMNIISQMLSKLPENRLTSLNFFISSLEGILLKKDIDVSRAYTQFCNEEFLDNIDNKTDYPSQIYNFKDEKMCEIDFFKFQFKSYLLPAILLIFTYFLLLFEILNIFNFKLTAFKIFDFKLNYLNLVCSYLFDFWHTVFGFRMINYNYSINIASFFEVIVFVFLVLFSAFWGAEVAEKNKKNRLVYFLAAILIPFIFPFLMKRFHFKNSNSKKVESSLLKIFTMFDREYKMNLFKKISLKDSGKSNGPFLFELNDKSIINPFKIKEAFTDSVEVCLNTKDADVVTLQIPYSKIERFYLKQ